VRHLHEHAALARNLGVQHAVQILNGDVLRLAPGDPAVVDRAPTGRLVVQDSTLVEAGDDMFRARRRLMHHGAVFVGIVMDAYGSLLARPQVSVGGATDGRSAPEVPSAAIDAVEDEIEALEDREAGDDDRVREAVRTGVRRGLRLPRDRRPIVEVQVTRLTAEALAQLEEAETPE
jgi:ribonuclease J